MKRLLLITSIILPLNLYSQFANFEKFKAERESKLKNDIILYYNPLLNNYDIHFVKLNLEVSNLSTNISGNVTIEAKVVNPLDTLVFDLHKAMHVDSFLINNVKVSASHINNQIQYVFNTPISSGSNVKVQIYYRGTPPSEGGGVTNAYSANWDRRVTWTLSESFHAYEWWPCKQVLSDKIDSTYIYLTCDSDCKSGSNGLLKDVVDLPNNKRRFEWKSYHPINYYLISFAVSEYQDYSIYAYPEGGDSILIQNFIYNTPGCLTNYKSDIDNTVDLIELFSEKFGLYPFANEKYGHCLTELGGGMEHQTMTTLGNFGYTLVAHELGHMWFGDYVTCASWQDIWINEGFASYTEYVALENLQPLSSAKDWIYYSHALALEEPEGSVYVPFEDAFNESRIFNHRLSYEKGAAIIHMIRHELNDNDLFFTLIRGYLSQYANNVASGDDFKNFIEQETGLDFDPFFDQWYYGKGYPRFDVEYAQPDDTLFLMVNESASSLETPLFQLHMDYKISFSGGDTTFRLFQSKNNEFFKIPLKKKVLKIEIDPDNWILNAPGTISVTEMPGNNKSLFKIYPNPVHENLTLLFNLNLRDKEKHVDIFDIHGRLMLSFETNDNLIQVNLNFLSKGVYLVKALSVDKAFTYPFIKQ